jgi:hypothetical protein
MRDRLIIGLSFAVIILGALAFTQWGASKAAEARAELAKARVEIAQHRADSVTAAAQATRDSLERVMQQTREVAVKAQQVAARKQLEADKAVVELRKELTVAQQERLDSVVSKYTQRIAADSVQLAALTRLTVQKDSVISTFERENQALRRLNRDLKDEIEAQKPRTNIKGEVISAVIGAAAWVLIDKATG